MSIKIKTDHKRIDKILESTFLGHGSFSRPEQGFALPRSSSCLVDEPYFDNWSDRRLRAQLTTEIDLHLALSYLRRLY